MAFSVSSRCLYSLFCDPFCTLQGASLQSLLLLSCFLLSNTHSLALLLQRPFDNAAPTKMIQDISLSQDSEFGAASLVAQLVKNLPVWKTWVGKIPWRREWLPTPVFWPGQFHGLYSPWSYKESDTTEQLSLSLEGQVLGICLPMQGTWFWSLVRKLRSHMPRSNEDHQPQLESMRRNERSHNTQWRTHVLQLRSVTAK